LNKAEQDKNKWINDYGLLLKEKMELEAELRKTRDENIKLRQLVQTANEATIDQSKAVTSLRVELEQVKV
jgi:hypothetical protein